MLFISFIYKMQVFFWGGDKKIPPGGHRRAGGIKNGRPARRIEKIPPAASAGWQIKKIPPAAPYPEQGRYQAAGFSSLVCFCLRTLYRRRKISRCGDAFPTRQAGQNLRLTAAPKVRTA